jgi:RimJ/RimL family protein N-acetyltransferase
VSVVPARASTPVVLRGGRAVRIRSLTPADAAALRDAIARADRFDMYRRFMGSPPAADALVGLLGRADGVHDAALGAFDAEGRIVAVGQFDRADDEPTAELAIEVASGWKRSGLGGALLSELCQLARSRGITKLTASYFADNTAIIRLLQSTGRSRWVDTQYGTSDSELDLRTPREDV